MVEQKDQKKKQIAEMISDLISGKLSDHDGDKIFEEISKLSPDPEWSNHVFQSNEFYDEDDTLDLDAVVEKIFSYKSIQL